MHVDAARPQRQRNASGSDREFKCLATAREVGEELDGRPEDFRREVLFGSRVVVPGNIADEGVLSHGGSLTDPRPPQGSSFSQDYEPPAPVRSRSSSTAAFRTPWG